MSCAPPAATGLDAHPQPLESSAKTGDGPIRAGTNTTPLRATAPRVGRAMVSEAQVLGRAAGGHGAYARSDLHGMT